MYNVNKSVFATGCREGIRLRKSVIFEVAPGNAEKLFAVADVFRFHFSRLTIHKADRIAADGSKKGRCTVIFTHSRLINSINVFFKFIDTVFWEQNSSKIN